MAKVNGDKKGEPRPASVQDDWQVAYVWAFIVKFGLVSKIRGLECLDDFERCLTQPVANRPDDVLEGICVRFLSNLKPGLTRLDCTNVQHHLSKYITDMLKTSQEFTVWDRPWPPNEEGRAGCCKPDLENRTRLGRLRDDSEEPDAREKRNPIKMMEEAGGGLFELDWFQRSKLLRQLVDWQLTHAEVIRERIKDEQAPPGKRTPEQIEKDAETSTKVVPIGMDRNKKRLWSLDDSARLYASGNPFKRPCPIVVVSRTREELEAQMAVYETHGAQTPGPIKGSGPKGRATAAESRAHRTLLQGIENEKALAAHIRDKIIPKIEANEKRILRAKKKEYERLAALQAAELRGTRTRRQTKVVNYRDLDEGTAFQIEDEPQPRRRGREATQAARPTIPGERRSARQRGRGSGSPGSEYANGYENGMDVDE